jgi:sec-independent protein translocase protein TatA
VFQVGPLELVVVLVIALLVLGPQRLPEVARSVGRGMREFRNAMNMEDDDEPEPPRPQVEAPPKVEQQPTQTQTPAS